MGKNKKPKICEMVDRGWASLDTQIGKNSVYVCGVDEKDCQYAKQKFTDSTGIELSVCGAKGHPEEPLIVDQRINVLYSKQGKIKEHSNLRGIKIEGYFDRFNNIQIIVDRNP